MASGAENEVAGTLIKDFLNDLRHLCDLIGLDWDEAAESTHYDEEVEGNL